MSRGWEELAAERCSRQGLDRARYRSVVELVGGVVALQAQEHGLSRWSLVQRLHGADDDQVRAALAAGTIVRTHVLRPTWHYVLGADLAWLQSLTSAAVRRSSAGWYRNHDVDDGFLERCKEHMAAVLADGTALTRDQVREELAYAGLDVGGQRLTIALFDAELDTLICSGAPAGTHHTYALASRRLPPCSAPLAEEGAALLLRRYVAGHGPATLDDANWWCGLGLRHLRRAAEALGDELVREQAGGVEYLSLAEERPPARARSARRGGESAGETPRFQLLHVFDELFTGYSRTRGLVDADGEYGAIVTRAVGPMQHLLLEGERLAGSWRRDTKGRNTVVSVMPTRRLDEADVSALRSEVERFGAFEGRGAELRLAGTGPLQI